MIAFIKSLFCRHDFRFHRNVFGDEIIFRTNGDRSIYHCTKCTKWTTAPYLVGGRDGIPENDKEPFENNKIT